MVLGATSHDVLDSLFLDDLQRHALGARSSAGQTTAHLTRQPAR
jgi:hypothetical protein